MLAEKRIPLKAKALPEYTGRAFFCTMGLAERPKFAKLERSMRRRKGKTRSGLGRLNQVAHSRFA
jgi:hypothetical protein